MPRCFMRTVLYRKKRKRMHHFVKISRSSNSVLVTTGNPEFCVSIGFGPLSVLLSLLTNPLRSRSDEVNKSSIFNLLSGNRSYRKSDHNLIHRRNPHFTADLLKLFLLFNIFTTHNNMNLVKYF